DALRDRAAAGPSGTERTRVNRLLLEAAYPGAVSDGGKQVLRFAAGGEGRELRVELPARAPVAAGTLELSESFRADRPAAADGTPTGSAQLDQDRGVSVGVGVSAAQRTTPAQPLLLRGVSLGLLVMEAGTELRVEIREDREGEPGGRALAAGKAAPGRPGAPAWVTVRLDDSVVVPPAPLWVVLTVASGRVVWLGREAAGAEVRLLDAPAGGGARGALAGLEAVHALISAATEAATSTTASAGDRPPLALLVGSHAVPPAKEEEGRRRLDLALPLAQYLAAQPAAPATVLVPLVFTAAVDGILTVFPPEITYELP
ncbi:MAG TPA: hypothetical protein VF263_04895, partial [Longimicrobiaceae bacterium]